MAKIKTQLALRLPRRFKVWYRDEAGNAKPIEYEALDAADAWRMFRQDFPRSVPLFQIRLVGPQR